MKKLLIIFLVLLFMLGCKTPVKNKIVPVSGKITFANGFNIPEGTKIVINPVEGQVQTASAIVDAQGNFKFVHATGKEGAELGNYIMVLYPPDFSVVPKYYTEEGLGKLEVTENTPALDLKIAGYLKKK